MGGWERLGELGRGWLPAPAVLQPERKALCCVAPGAVQLSQEMMTVQCDRHASFSSLRIAKYIHEWKHHVISVDVYNFCCKIIKKKQDDYKYNMLL